MQPNDWNNIKFSEQEKQQLADKLYASTQRTEKQQKPFRRPLRPIAVALLFVIGISVAGYAATTIRNVIKENFKGTPAANTNFEQNITYLGLTDTWNGWSLTLTDVIGDYSAVWIGFELKSPENCKFDPARYYHFDDRDIQFKPKFSYFKGINVENMKFVDEHTLTGVLEIRTDVPLQNELVSISLSKFYDIYDELDTTAKTETYIRHTLTEDYQEINQHTFSFKNVPLNYKTMEITLTPNDKVSVFQGEAILTKIIISPISVTARVEGEGCKNHHYKPSSRPEVYLDSNRPEVYLDSNIKVLDGSVYNQACLRELGLKVICKDGSEMKFTSGSGSCEDKTKPYYIEKTQRTKQEIIDLDNIAYIEVCGRRYTIPTQAE